MTQVTKPATCAALNAVSPEFGSPKCKRLPRHAGDCRSTKRRPAVVRKPRVTGAASVKASPRKLSAAKRRLLIVKLASQVEAGIITPSQAMSKFAAATK